MNPVTPYKPRSIESAGARQEREEAIARGFDEGLTLARAQAAAELDGDRAALRAEFADRTAQLEDDYRAALRTVEASASALNVLLTETVAGAQAEVDSTALTLAEAILGAELTEASSRARAAITRVLAQVDLDQINDVRMHPDDVAAVSAMPDIPAVKLTADPTLLPGDAVATLPDGWLDSRIVETLERVRAALDAEHAHEHAHEHAAEVTL